MTQSRPSRPLGHSFHTRFAPSLAGLGLVLFSSGCFSNQIGVTTTEPTDDGAYSDLGELATSSETRAASGQCSQYDITSPTRSICISCYDELLEENCNGSTTIDECEDTEFQSRFAPLLNQCIAASTAAGFTCSLSCSSGTILDPSACQCITQPAEDNAGDVGWDAGQSNYGPPLSSLYWPSTSQFIGESNTSPADVPDYDSAESCTIEVDAAAPLPVLVRNRGNTSPQNNFYALPILSTIFNAMGVNLFEDSSPIFKLTSLINGLEANTGIALTLASGGVKEFQEFTDVATGAEIGRVQNLYSGKVQLYSDAPITQNLVTQAADIIDDIDDVDRGDPVDTQPFLTQPWSVPGYMTRDAGGNIFVVSYLTRLPSVATKQAGNIFYICVENALPGLCNGKIVGRIYSLNLGAPNQFIGGIAVDRFGNVYFSINQINAPYAAIGIYVYCAATGAATPTQCLAPTVTANIEKIVDAGYLYPAGLDIELKADGSAVNVYTADIRTGANSRIIAHCTYNTGAKGPCSGWPNGDLNTSDALYEGPNLDARFTDVKLLHTGNLYFTDFGQGQVLGICQDYDEGDPCDSRGNPVAGSADPRNFAPIAGPGAAGPRIYRITSSTGTASGADNGKHAYFTHIPAPIQLVVAKRTADEITPSATATPQQILAAEAFRDNNLIVVSAQGGTEPAFTATGNTLQLICGEPYEYDDSDADANTDAYLSGLCAGRSPHHTYRLAGVTGHSAPTVTGFPAEITPFANLRGATYDGFKNVIVSSAYGTKETGKYWVDDALYLIPSNSESPTTGAAYSITDANLASSRYCLRTRVRTQCRYTLDSDTGTTVIPYCQCSALPGGADGQSAWELISSTATCPN